MFLQETSGHKPKKAQTPSLHPRGAVTGLHPGEGWWASPRDPEGQGRFKGSISTRSLTLIQAFK